jgi:hypothetical protein
LNSWRGATPVLKMGASQQPGGQLNAAKMEARFSANAGKHRLAGEGTLRLNHRQLLGHRPPGWLNISLSSSA